MCQISRHASIVAIVLFGGWANVLAGDPQFTEMADQVGVAVVHGASGYAHANYTGGGAVGDFNNDGWQDLFVLSGGDDNQPDRLFINSGRGTFTDLAAEWGLGEVHKGKGAAVADFNNDGWLDLFVTSAGWTGNVGPGHHRLYKNNGDNTFTDIAASAGVNFSAPSQEDGFGATFGDYDLDGDLDLFVSGFTNGNAGSRLFRNNGDETFTDVTAAIGFFNGTPISVHCFAPRFADMDGDWYPDLLLAADFGTSRYFKNNTDGTFTDITAASGTSQEENGMGQNIGDVNGDGLMDWYVTSIYYTPLNWTGNKLYYNSGNHSYHEAAAGAGVFDGGYGWGSLLVDFNHDGLLDIAETNGDDGNFGNVFQNEQSYLWVQNSNGSFSEMAIASGFEHFGKGRGMVNFDYDNDGDQDVVIFANDEILTFFNNDINGPDAHWLRVFLDSSAEPALAPNGHGARVSVTIGEQTQVRMITTGDNFLTHSELSAHFGLGTATSVDQLKVQWPNGMITVQQNVAVDQTMTIQFSVILGDLNGDGVVNASDLAILLGSWGPCQGCPADLNNDGVVNAADLAMLLGNWG